jgi:hypothetical protein
MHQVEILFNNPQSAKNVLHHRCYNDIRVSFDWFIRENQNEVEDDGWFTLTQSQPVDVALCWDDLIEKENCKVKIPFVQNSQQTREVDSLKYCV